MSADGYWQLCYQRSAYAERFLETWHRAGLDAVLCPPHALPALRHGTSGDLSMTASYCFFVNVLGLPAGIVPATRVRSGEESDRQVGRDLVDRAAQAVELGSVGLPVGVQVVAPPWREETVLAVMSALETHFRGQSDFPRTPVDPAADSSQ
jgi:fatty acid amide hydrolase